MRRHIGAGRRPVERIHDIIPLIRKARQSTQSARAGKRACQIRPANQNQKIVEAWTRISMPRVNLHAPTGCVPAVVFGHSSNAAPKPYCRAKAVVNITRLSEEAARADSSGGKAWL